MTFYLNYYFFGVAKPQPTKATTNNYWTFALKCTLKVHEVGYKKSRPICEHTLTQLLTMFPNNAEIKGRLCILLFDKLLSTAAETRNDYLPERHTKQYTGSQHNNSLLKW